MIKGYDYIIFILDIHEAKTQTEIPLNKIDKVQVDIEMRHKTPYKERYIAGSSTCSTKELSIHLTRFCLQ